jgi:hypothetical protein
MRSQFTNQVRYLGVFLATMGCQCNVPAQISLAQTNAIGSARRSVMAVVTIWGGASGGIIGSLIFRTQDAPHYTPGLFTSISMASCIILGMLGLGSYYHLCNKRAEKGVVIHGIEGYRYSL